MTVSEVVAGALESLKSSSAPSSSSHLIWVDMPCHLAPETSTADGHHWDCRSAQEIDQNLRTIIEHTQTGDVICVLTQGDLSAVKRLMCHKQK
jgi:hypothetical protein